MKKVIELKYNYRPPYLEWSEDYDVAKVGEKGVLEIIEHAAAGEGDKWYYDIVYSNKTVRTFYPYMVDYKVEDSAF